MKPSTYRNALDRLPANPTRRVIKRMVNIAIKAFRSGDTPLPVQLVRKYHKAHQRQFNPRSM